MRPAPWANAYAHRARLACSNFFNATGLRVSELVALPASAAQTKDPFIHIRGKGGRERLVPLSSAAREAIAAYRSFLKKTHAGASAGPRAVSG